MLIEHSLFPKVVISGRETSLSASGLGVHMPHGVYIASKRKPQRIWDHELDSDGAGHLRWTEVFPSQDERVIDILARDAQRVVFSANIYALPPARAGLLPLRCDLHPHVLFGWPRVATRDGHPRTRTGPGYDRHHGSQSVRALS